jgi:GDP-L-fucose synthase
LIGLSNGKCVDGYADCCGEICRRDGAPRKLLDLTRIRRLGWASKIGLEQGLRDTYRWFIEHAGSVRGG